MSKADPFASQRYQTKQEFVYHTLRRAIMQAELVPGQRLRTDEIAHRLGVSSIPVREALQLLQSERLVEIVPHIGSRVTRLSPDMIREVFTVMEGLELVATRTAADRMTALQHAELETLLHAMDRALSIGAYDEWSDLNTTFHHTIAAITGMLIVLEMTDRTFSQWDRVRRFYAATLPALRFTQAQHEHYAMVQAMRDHDYPALEDVVRKHTEGALAAYIDTVSGAKHT